MENVLSIINLEKNYGKFQALNSLSLEIRPGTIFGLLGPNGSGKTTTLGIVLDVINKSGGDFRWFGKPADYSTRKKIGAILESPSFYPYLSATQNLKIIAKIKEISPHRIDEVLQVVNLFERRNDPFKTYSLGMKQRLAIASALLADPEVLILDEPTNGLDPQGIVEVRRLIIQIAGMGKTIVLASHLLDEVQKVCTDFAVLRRGKLVYTGSVTEALAGKELVEVLSDDIDRLRRSLDDFPYVNSVERDAAVFVVSLKDGKKAQDLHGFLIENGIVLSHLLTRKRNLEQEFLSILAAHD